MNKFQFLERLDRLLSTLPYNEKRDIMYDYEELFNESSKEGKSEEDIIKELGSPELIASKYLPSLPAVVPNKKETSSNNSSKKGNSTAEVVALTIIALILNGLFILGPYIGLWGIIVGFIVSGFALIVTGFVLLISALFAVPLSFINVPFIFMQHPIILVCISIALICIGGLILIGFYYITRFTCIVTYKYVKWLIKVIRGY